MSKLQMSIESQMRFSRHLKNSNLQPFAIGVFHEFLELMLGEVVRRSPKAVSNLRGD